MAAISGDLSVLTISNLVQALVLDRCTGFLTVDTGTDRRILRISPAGIRLVRGSQRCHRLERMLHRLGRTPAPAVIPSPEAVAHLVQAWILEETCDLFSRRRGTFRFETTSAAEQGSDGPFAPYASDYDVTTIALEAARWADDVLRIKSAIHDLRLIPILNEAPISGETATLDPEALHDVLRLIDGDRPVIQILQLSVFPRFVVLKMLYRLMLDGAVELTTPGLTPTRVAVPLHAAA
jgi:hypothetical protein